MATYLVTGVAGFIAARTTQMLLDAGHTIVGVDNLNDYYDVRVKQHRLARLTGRPNFSFAQLDIEQMAALEPLFAQHRFDAVTISRPAPACATASRIPTSTSPRTSTPR